MIKVMNIEKEELLLEAIEDYELYSKSQRAMLKILIQTSIDNIASISTSFLMKKLNLSRYSVYLILKQLEKDNLIERIKKDGMRHDCFKINYLGLDHIIQLYQKKSLI